MAYQKMVDKLKQQKRQNLIIHAFALLLFSFLGAYILQHFILAAPANYSVPTSYGGQAITSNCSSDDTSPLNSWIASLPADATAVFPSNGCYLVNGTLLVQDAGGLTINGNGSTIERTTARTTTNSVPQVELFEDIGLTITGLNVVGPFNGSNGGPALEGNEGIKMECNNGTILNGISETNIQGDFLDLLQPYECKGSSFFPLASEALNTNITITNSKFNGAGYDGLAIEAGNGVTFSNNTLSNMQESAMDFETDIYSSGYYLNGKACDPTTTSGCNVGYTAQDNLNITNNTWRSFNVDFFASLQGQTPGVQEDNLNLTNNTIEGSPSGLMVQIHGTPLNKTSQYYWDQNINISNNTSTTDARGVNGGDMANSSSTMQIQNVNNLQVNNNVSPVRGVDDSTTPYLGAIQGGANNGVMQNNKFPGALDVINPVNSYNMGGMSFCNNTYGVGGTKTDATCNTHPVPTVPTNVKAVANGPNSVNVSWSPSSVSGSTIGGYNILRGGVKVGSANASSTSYPDNTVSPSTTYSYTVEAYDTATPPDVSAVSSPAASVTTPPAGTSTKPSAPTNLKASITSPNVVTLSWTASTDSGSTIGGYDILRGGNKYAQVSGANSTSFMDKSVTSGDTYSYSVEAYVGNVVSDPSNTVNITIPGGGTIINPGGPPVPVVTASSSSKPTLCVPAGVNTSQVNNVTFSVGGQTVTTAPGQLCTSSISTSSLSAGTHTVTLTLHNQNGTTSSYKEQLKIKPANWVSTNRYWLVAIILLVLLVFDIAWMYIRPNHKSHKSYLGHQAASHDANNIPVPPTVVSPNKKHNDKE